MKTKNIYLIIAIVLIIGAVSYLESTKIAPLSGSSSQANLIEVVGDGGYPRAPELVGISGYLNTEDGIKIEDFTSQGKIVLIDFWTYTCINCIRTFPYLTSWDEKYRDEGLVIIGVHTPEFEFEKKYENVKDAIEKYNIQYAVVQDNDYATWTAYQNRYWPRKYLIDSNGFIRYDHIGEGGYEETEAKIKELLSEIGENVSNIKITEDQSDSFRITTTPELYAGHKFALSRGQDLGNLEGMLPGETIDYTIPDSLISDKIYLEGMWKSNPDDLQLMGNEGTIVLDFSGKSVNIVADSKNGEIIMEVFISGKYVSKEQAGSDIQFEGDKSFIVIDKPFLYNIIEGNYGRYKLTLKINSKDFNFNAFTFG